MSNDGWKYPWPKPISHYDSDGPRTKPLSFEPLDFELFGVQLRITTTGEEGVDTGRIRYRIECVTCDVLIHQATTGPSSLFDDHLRETHGWVRAVVPSLNLPSREWASATLPAGLATPAPALDTCSEAHPGADVYHSEGHGPPPRRPSTPSPEEIQKAFATPPTKPERKRRDLTMGDRWRLELECVKPGESALVVYIDGKQEGRVPIGNVLQIHARFDEGAADAAQQQIAMWRGRAGDWESKYLDKQVDTMRLRQLEGELGATKDARAAAESELAHLRQTMPPPGDPALAAEHRVLLKAARAQLARCLRCQGRGHITEPEGPVVAVNGVAVMPCPACGTFRELLADMGAVGGTRSVVAEVMFVPESRDLNEARAEMYNAEFKREDERRSRPTDSASAAWARAEVRDAEMERADERIGSFTVTLSAPPPQELVFLLHPGVGTGPYWELGSPADPTVQARLRGDITTLDAFPQLPPGWAAGHYLALTGGYSEWYDVTALVTVDKVRGLAACPEWVRERYLKVLEALQ